MAFDSKRPLYKSPLLPPKHQPWSESYTVDSASKDELARKVVNTSKIPVIEFKSGDVPMPFLDPSIISRRIQEAKDMETKPDRERIQDEPSQNT
ncbi:uncharacterized protein RAG0_12333 [Rhynchosporium agropyri]|uniref:Uncharacterized protein n=3 Tax=Rhynchosporium TaxID=38037 RepID=A0A1E1MCP1_RHYSE|nr:uncharacterized protein RCO7_05685 [Rhynchosporium commune]CZT06659.1 uncharacterized protein RAG0_12333 [Rhynchosporium agropyri]CZT46847.1 uncharacterized protein RSE6_07348 [Rhynchosporium secalis]